jgi:hypothetical protein
MKTFPATHAKLAPLALSGLCLLALEAAPIPGLFNTGVNDNGQLLSDNAVDPHYTLMESADPAFPGPETRTLLPGFPVGPWLAEGPDSRWIAPRAAQSIGNQPGNYTFRTTFDLTGFDPAKASITGRWAVDNGGVDMVLNGVSLGLVNAGGFGGFTDFAIVSDFVEGTNTLDFVVSNAEPGVNPTGLRVELRGTVELPSEAPSILSQPKDQSAIVGETVTLSVVADGTPPLSYQWRLGGSDLADALDATLTLPAIAANQAGNYDVLVRNAVGSVTSGVAVVTVFEPLPGLYNTGVGDDRMVLEDYTLDPHYQLILNADGGGLEPVVQDSLVFPIVTGPWVPNSDTSKWIGPRGETSAAAGGDYVYRLVLDLTGLDPATAFITGRWSTDNVGLDILLNGVSTGVKNDAQFGGYTDFRLVRGFLSGANTLDFKLNNSDPVAGYTGLRVEGLRGGAVKGTAAHPPTIDTPPRDRLAVVGDQVTFTVEAGGTPPFSYQWFLGDQGLPGETNPRLVLPGVTRGQSGDYAVVVSNAVSAVTSRAAKLKVLERIPGLFSTGVGADGAVLADYAVDPHYRLVANADGQSEQALVEDSTLFPIVAGPWVANTAVSKWIGPRGDTAGAAGGDYAYEVSFDLTGFDPSTVFLLGAWATDNVGMDVLLNGHSTGLLNGNQFASWTELTLTSGFVAGRNTVRFVVNNAAEGWTGLRVDDLRAGGERTSAQDWALAIARSGDRIVLSWPTSATGFLVFATDSLSAPNWLLVAEPVVISGDRHTVNLPLGAGPRFFRLQK